MSLTNFKKHNDINKIIRSNNNGIAVKNIYTSGGPVYNYRPSDIILKYNSYGKLFELITFSYFNFRSADYDLNMHIITTHIKFKIFLIAVIFTCNVFYF